MFSKLFPRTPSLSVALQRDTEAICYRQGRMVGSAGHEDAHLHLRQRLQDIGCIPFAGDSLELSYTWKKTRFCNLAGCLPGRNRNLAPILIGAHYDSVIPHPCADDNAAAVAIALQAGLRLAQEEPLERDVVIALFDAEEPPYFLSEGMGSVRFYEDHVQGIRDIHAAIVMDLVGHDVSVPMSLLSGLPLLGGLAEWIPGLSNRDMTLPGIGSALFVTGGESHEEMAATLRELGQPEGLKVVPTRNDYIGDMSDHGVFRRHGVPYYFLSCGQWRHYHAPTDTPDRLNYDKMANITRYVVRLAGSLVRCSLEGRNGLEQTVETLPLETGFLRTALGPLEKPLLSALGIDGLKTRQDMDRFVQFLLSSGLG